MALAVIAYPCNFWNAFCLFCEQCELMNNLNLPTLDESTMFTTNFPNLIRTQSAAFSCISRQATAHWLLVVCWLRAVGLVQASAACFVLLSERRRLDHSSIPYRVRDACYLPFELSSARVLQGEGLPVHALQQGLQTACCFERCSRFVVFVVFVFFE